MKLSTIERSISSGAIGLMLLGGCASKSPPPAATPEVATIANVPPALPPPNNNETSVHVSEEIRKACTLPDGAQEAPRFDYDEATLRPRGENILDDVASCLKDGPLKGSAISIIGRTDPRGSQQYNQELGTTRAEAARNYLAERNVPLANMNVMSRGEQGATGNDESSWELDRRVDIELGSESPSARNVSGVE